MKVKKHGFFALRGRSAPLAIEPVPQVTIALVYPTVEVYVFTLILN